MESKQIMALGIQESLTQLNIRIKEALQNEISPDDLKELLNDCLQYFNAPMESLASAYNLELSLLQLSRKYWHIISAPFERTATTLRFEEASIQEHIGRVYCAVEEHAQRRVSAEKSQQVLEEPPLLIYEFNRIAAFAYLYADRKLNFFYILEIIAKNAYKTNLIKTEVFSGFFAHLMADYFDLLLNNNVNFFVLAKQVKLLGEILKDYSYHVMALSEFIKRNQATPIKSEQAVGFVLNQLIHLLEESADSLFLPGGQGKLLNLMDSLRPILTQTKSAEILNLCDVYACKFYARINTNTSPNLVEYRLFTFWLFILDLCNINFSDQIDLVKVSFLTPSVFSESELTLPVEVKDLAQEVKHLRRTETGDLWILASLVHLSRLLNSMTAFKPFKEFRQAEVMQQLRDLELAVQKCNFQNEEEAVGYHRSKLRLLLHFLPYSFSPIVYVNFFAYINKVFNKYPFLKLEPEFAQIEYNFLGLFPDKALLWVNQLLQGHKELLNHLFSIMPLYRKFADEVDASFYHNWSFMMLLGYSNNADIMSMVTINQKPKLSAQDSAIIRKMKNLGKIEKKVVKEEIKEHLSKINENLKCLNNGFLGGDFNCDLYSDKSIQYFKLSLPYKFGNNDEFCLKLRNQTMVFGFSATIRNDPNLLKTKKQKLFQDIHNAVLNYFQQCGVKIVVRENGLLLNFYKFSPKKESIFNHQAAQKVSANSGQLLESLESIRQKYLEPSSTAKILGSENCKTSSPVMELDKLDLPEELKAHIRGMLQGKENVVPKASKTEQGKAPKKKKGPGLFGGTQEQAAVSPLKQQPANDNAELEPKGFG
jgi:hypothetical protein